MPVHATAPWNLQQHHGDETQRPLGNPYPRECHGKYRGDLRSNEEDIIVGPETNNNDTDVSYRKRSSSIWDRHCYSYKQKQRQQAFLGDPAPPGFFSQHMVNRLS